MFVGAILGLKLRIFLLVNNYFFVLMNQVFTLLLYFEYVVDILGIKII